MKFPCEIFSGYYGKCHCQGIALDVKNGYIYYSFTTMLVKSDLNGNIIGSVTGLVGHLGCIDFNEADGRVWGSLEYKNDSIGKGILSALNESDREVQDGFYCAIFDVSKIDRLDMDAEKDGVMRAVYLPEVLEDYKAEFDLDGKRLVHRYGCSGIDGLAFGPSFDGSGRDMLHICYGIYGDIERSDNDYQVLLAFDPEGLRENYAKPLSQSNVHRDGVRCEKRYFLYTGNTTWGVQNLEYDAYTDSWLVAVYTGKKKSFPNYSMFVIDGKKAPITVKHEQYGEEISLLSLVGSENAQDIRGNYFPYGSTGIYAFGNGYYYFSRPGADENGSQYTNVALYRYDNNEPNLFKAVSDPLEI